MRSWGWQTSAGGSCGSQGSACSAVTVIPVSAHAWFSGVARREFKNGKMLMLSAMFSIPKLSQDCPQFSLSDLGPLPLPKQSCLLLIMLRDLQGQEGGFPSLLATLEGNEEAARVSLHSAKSHRTCLHETAKLLISNYTLQLCL